MQSHVGLGPCCGKPPIIDERRRKLCIPSSAETCRKCTISALLPTSIIGGPKVLPIKPVPPGAFNVKVGDVDPLHPVELVFFSQMCN